MTLDEIFIECQTDKSSQTHCYAQHYEKYFESWRDKQFVMLEIGVSAGGSIKAWRKYFPKAKIYGLDNNPDCAGEGIFIGSQIDKEFLDKIIHTIGPVDIIIDDGSHFGPYTIETFKHLFEKVNNGGFYVVEDTHCFYDRTYGEAPDFGKGMSAVFNFFTSLACDVDVHGRGYTGNREYALKLDNPNFAPVPKYSHILKSIHIHQSLWLFQRI